LKQKKLAKGGKGKDVLPLQQMGTERSVEPKQETTYNVNHITIVGGKASTPPSTERSDWRGGKSYGSIQIAREMTAGERRKKNGEGRQSGGVLGEKVTKAPSSSA